MTEVGNRGYGLPAAIEAFAEARTEDAVFVVGSNYRIVYWEPGAELLTGLAHREVAGKLLYEALAGGRKGGTPFCRHGCPVMGLARSRRPVPSHEVRLYSPSGGQRWVGVTVLVVDAEEGPYLIGLLRDSQRTHDALEMALARLSSGNASGASGESPELTPYQLEVLELLSEGNSAKAVGRELDIAEATVRGHVRALLSAFGAHSQVEALARAREMGLLPR